MSYPDAVWPARALATGFELASIEGKLPEPLLELLTMQNSTGSTARFNLWAKGNSPGRF